MYRISFVPLSELHTLTRFNWSLQGTLYCSEITLVENHFNFHVHFLLAIKDKYSNWKEFLKRRLTGARTLPSNFYSKVHDSMKSRFRCDLTVEVVDRNRISQVKVATIEKVVGKRLQLRYYDSKPNSGDCKYCYRR